MNPLNNIQNDLTCPITGALFEDPISVPCCGKAFERPALLQWFDRNTICPLCSSNLSNFDVHNVAKNTTISSLVDSYKNGQTTLTKNKHQWSATLTPVPGTTINQLKISIDKSNFVTKPSLFIAVVDRSGSMAGSPWKQVETALIHIMGLSMTAGLGNSSVKTVIVAYDSFAEIINTSGTQEQVNNTIKTMFNGGGTNFNAAFNKVKDVLENYTCSDDPSLLHNDNNVSSVTIAFLTDGQSGENRDELTRTFKEILENCWTGLGPLSVHAIGFGRGCDKVLLEKLRTAGPTEGTFRYAEPSDDGDTLCHKFQSLFDVASKSCSVPVKLSLDGITTQRYNAGLQERTQSGIKFRSNNSTDLDVHFPIDKFKNGVLKRWVLTSNDVNFSTLTINSPLDKDLKLEVKVDTTIQVTDQWFSVLIDELAAELLNLSNKKSEHTPNNFDLYCGLILQRIEALLTSTQDSGSISRLEILAQQTENLRSGASVNTGRLSDLRFGSMFGVMKPIDNKPQSTWIAPNANKPVDDKPRYVERRINYSRNNDSKNRNTLQEAIMDNEFNSITTPIQHYLDNSVLSDMKYTDLDGNNVLHLATFCGHSYLVEKILHKYPNLDLTVKNGDDETAMTLAIKKRGFWVTIETLLKAGATIPSERSKGLEQYAIDNGYPNTAKIISNVSEGSTDVNESMTSEYINFLYNNKTENSSLQGSSSPLDQKEADKFLNVCLSKAALSEGHANSSIAQQDMLKLVKELLSKHNAQPAIDMLMRHCVPPKPDSPDVHKYLKLCRILLQNTPDLIRQVDEKGDSPLHKACEKGNLPHVRFFLQKGAELDKPNKLGNTPLWVSCAKHYPCIIAELINNGADVNYTNLKGNPPIYNLCQRGPLKIAEKLLSKGASLDYYNKNGDTPILLCCRNGQHEKLELFLNYVDPDFIDFKAKIDGFSAILAATEANKPECIKVLHEFEVDLETKTDDDNQIIRGATSLHLAAYYGKTEATSMLLSLGADPNSVDVSGQTPLHVAVIQGHIPIIKLLRNNPKTIIMQKDNYGSTPASYCRNRDDIRKVLVNPAIDVLMKLAKGFDRKEEQSACDILIKHSNVIGCLTSKQAVDLQGSDGSTPLMQAVIHSSFKVVATLMELGADPSIKNNYGMSSYDWAHWIKNPRIKKLLKVDDTDVNHEIIDRLEKASKLSNQDASILFLIKPKATLHVLSSSGIQSRMEEYVNCSSIYEQTSKKYNDTLLAIKDGQNIDVGEMFDMYNECASQRQLTGEDRVRYNSEYTHLLWYAKVFTTNITASGNVLTPSQIFALALHTNNPELHKIINNQLYKDDVIIKPYLKCLHNALDVLEPCDSEVFIGSDSVDRDMYQVGNKICWPNFMSGSTIWRVATENTKDFAGKKQGTILLIKSKTGRFVFQYSQFAYDAEVIFKPNTKFEVSAWYRGSVIALGQANIREHTFGIKEDEKATYLNSNKSLIIELQEI